MLRLVAFVAALVTACAASRGHHEFALELVDRASPSKGFRHIGDEILVEQETIDAVREVIELRGGKLLALVQFPQGVHPYLVVALAEREESVDLLMTSVYWGRIQAKWAGRVDTATVESLIHLATATFECSTGAVEDFLFGAALVHWIGEDQVVCDGGWLSDRSALLAKRIQPILDAAAPTYETRHD